MGSVKFRQSHIHALSVLFLCFCSCAQISSPTGGPMDEDPPQVLSMEPSSDMVNVRPSKLSIAFDEFVALKNPQQQLVISPPILTKPSFRIRGKSVELEMDPALYQDSTTYVFSFGKGIVDLHESNPAVDLKWAFSTGPTIDSLELAGQIVDRTTGDAKEGLRILLFRNPYELDSVLSGALPDAVGVTNAEGVFRIDHLSAGNFFPLALDDVNANYAWDEGEYLAFDSVLIASGDSTQSIFLGFQPQEEDGLKYIESSYVDSTGAIRISAPLLGEVESEEWKALSQGAGIRSPWERTADSVFMWIDSTLIEDAMELQVVWSGRSFNDTSSVRLDRKSPRKRPMPLEKLPRSSVAETSRALSFDRAVQVQDSSRWMLISDSDTLSLSDFSVSDVRDGNLSRELYLNHAESDGAEYQLVAFPNAFTNPFGVAQTDTLTWRWKAHPSDFFGELKVELSNLPGAGWFILQLNKKPPFRLQCSADTALVFERLIPGTYKLGFEWDVNGNGVWELGDLKRFEVPEPYFYPAENPAIRSNWLVEWLWDFASDPESSEPIE